MITSKTYVVGSPGFVVQRKNNLSGAWIDVWVSTSFPGAGSYPLWDVMTDPNDGDKVFTVGGGGGISPVRGIYVSNDGGFNWLIPGGNYQTNTDLSGNLNWNEVWVIDSQNIAVAGDNGYVAISNDGGLTFNLVNQLPNLPDFQGGPAVTPRCLSIHWISPTVGVVGTQAHVLKTIDGGSSWTILNGGNIINTVAGSDGITGIHLSADEQTIVAITNNYIYRSVDGGVSWVIAHAFQVDPNTGLGGGVHLTWTDDNNIWGFGLGYNRVRSIDAGATWTVLSAFNVFGSPHYGAHFYNGIEGFYTQENEVYQTLDGAVTGILDNPLFPSGPAAVWTWYQEETCYQLTACDNSVAPFIVTNDLSSFVGQVVTVCPGDIPSALRTAQAIPNSQEQESEPTPGGTGGINITTCTCFRITEAVKCTGAITLVNTPLAAVPTCDDCVPQKCYYLVDCKDPNRFIKTSEDLQLYVNKVIKLQYDDETCWQVLDAPDCKDPLSSIAPIVGSFDTCIECDPPIEPEPIDLRTRSIKPGYDTPGCPPEYTEKVNCTFADQMYQQMVSQRYGIQFCCPEDLEKWTIKKSLLDLKAIYNPDLCKCLLQVCCPPECVDAELLVFNPRGCDPPELIDAILDYPTDCLPPNTVIAALVVPAPPQCRCYELDQKTDGSTVQYTPCGTEGFVTINLVAPETQYVCSDVPPITVAGTAPIITIIQGADCEAGLCP